MARVSFTLRRNVIDRGSYARYDPTTYNAAASAGNTASPGSWIEDNPLGTRDNDTSLRSDGYQIPPVEFSTSYLEAYAVAYDKVQINWKAPLSTIDSSPTPTQTVLVYSPYGPAATISSGVILSEGSTEFTRTQTGLVGGESGWAYYTLFIRYQSTGGDNYYEPAATVEVLVPRNYGSTTLLWNRIPEYYRNADSALATEYVDPTSDYAINELGALPPDGRPGPLFKFLSIFGFEMDKTRTIIDYLMVAKDPSIANVENLDALASMMNIGINSRSINASRIRSLLDGVGELRREKGTVDGIVDYAHAISNCDVEIDQSTRKLIAYSQRVNYITDPADATNMVTSRPAHEAEAVPLGSFEGGYDPTNYNANDDTTWPLSVNEVYVPGMYWIASAAGTMGSIPVSIGDRIVCYTDSNGDTAFSPIGYDFLSTKYSAYNTYSHTGVTYIPNTSGVSAGVTQIMFHIDCPIPVASGDSVYFSVHSGVGTSALKWGRIVDESGNVLGQSSRLTRAGDSVAVEVPIPDNLQTSEWVIGFIEFLVDLSSVSQYNLSSLLAERNYLGGYFDGNSSRGGWLVDPTGVTVSDYRWSSEGENNGNAFQSISIYTEDYQRTRTLLQAVVPYLLPITQSQYYSFLATDAIPGQSAIDTYLTTP